MKNLISAISLFAIIMSTLGTVTIAIQEWNRKSDRVEYLEQKVKSLSYLEAIDGPTVCMIDESIGARAMCNCYQKQMGKKNVTECVHYAQTNTSPIYSISFKTRIIQ